MNIFARMRLKSMLRNCDYVLAGTVLKQQYYDENKDTELNRLIDEFMANPGFDNAVKLIEYNEMLVFYFTESCHGGLYVRKAEEAAKESAPRAQEDRDAEAFDGDKRSGTKLAAKEHLAKEPASRDIALERLGGRAAVAPEDAVTESGPKDGLEAPEPALKDKRREKYERLENAWNELLSDPHLNPKLKKLEPSRPELSRDFRESERKETELQPVFATEESKPAPPVSARADIPEEMDPAASDLLADMTVPDERDVLPKTERVPAMDPEWPKDDPASAAQSGYPDTANDPGEGHPAKARKEPEVFYETMPFRNPYEEYERSFSPEGTDRSFERSFDRKFDQSFDHTFDQNFGQSFDRTDSYIGEGAGGAMRESAAAQAPLKENPAERPAGGITAEEEDEMNTIVPQHTRFPNVIGTLKIDIRDMKQQVAEYRRLIAEDPAQRDTYEPWIRALEEAIEEFTLSVAILSQYRP